jgi:hypothetical protein
LEQNVTAKPRKSSRKKGVKIPGKILLRWKKVGGLGLILVTKIWKIWKIFG